MSVEINSLFQLYGESKSIEMVLEATGKLRQTVLENQKEEIILSPKAMKLKEQCISFGPDGGKWAKIISIIIDEDIRVQDSTEVYNSIRFAALVPKTSYDGHNYHIGLPYFMFMKHENSTDIIQMIRAIKHDGILGNNIKPYIKSNTIASDELIISSLKGLFKRVGEIQPLL